VYGYWPGMFVENGDQLRRNDAVLTYTALNTPLVCRGSNDWFRVAVRNADGSLKNVNLIPQGDNILYRSLLPFDTRRSGDLNLNVLNPRRIRFLELKAEDSPLAVSFPDPWDGEYCVVMGLDPSRSTTLLDDVWPIITFSNQTAVVLSRNRSVPNTYQYIFNSGVTNGIVRRAN